MEKTEEKGRLEQTQKCKAKTCEIPWFITVKIAKTCEIPWFITV